MDIRPERSQLRKCLSKSYGRAKELRFRYCIGAISSESAWRLAYYRGTLAATLLKQGHPQGGMISVGLSKSECAAYLDDIADKFGHRGLVIACINSPKNLTLSGDIDQINALDVILDRQAVFARKLRVNIAYHSPHMNTISREYMAMIGNLKRGELPGNECNMISSVTGARISTDEASKGQYWVQNMVSTVNFAGALETICNQSGKPLQKKLDRSHRGHVVLNSLLEVGPHAGLQGPIRDVLGKMDQTQSISYASALIRGQSALESVMKAGGQLYSLGYPVNITRINNTDAHPGFRTLSNLPEYPFDHSQTYWHETRIGKAYRFRTPPRLDLLGKQVTDWNPLQARWRHFISVTEQTWVEDHKVCEHSPLLMC